MRKGTILTLHIIPNRKQYTISFEMAYNATLCAVGTITPQVTYFFEFGRSTDSTFR